jgi:two-component system chemotaxis response regulator CheY
MIVDDSATMRRIIISSLNHIGFQDCIEAANAADALARFDDTVDCVLTDWNMPNMSGVEFARALRATEHGATVPIVMITTRSVRDDIVQAAQAGVTNYIVKPFTPQVLKEKLNHVLALSEGV